jgi:tRNA pseudouridine32 synthase/23S rRNA pseudouridine746 synthase
MGHRGKPPAAPLPQRYGIDPVRVRLPADGPWPTVRDYLVERLSGAGEGVVDRMLREGAVVDADGVSVPVDAPFAPSRWLWFHRELPPEPEVPFPLEVLHRDDTLLVVDKPHFLAMTPRGSHVTETALARLRRELDLPRLSPAHRLDRLTAGVALFTVRPQARAAYQLLFQSRAVHKEYEAVARYDAALRLPLVRRSRIEKKHGVLAAYETEGEPNAEMRVELVQRIGQDLARYRLLPATGRTHQLRVHMNALGVPIAGDPLYPEIRDEPPDDFSRPLQLLARSLEFTDPLTGTTRRFESRRRLSGGATIPSS